MTASNPARAARLWLFFLIAFVGTWGFAGLFWLFDPSVSRGEGPGMITMAASYVAVWAPSAAGLFLAWRYRGRDGFVALLKRLWQWPGTIWLVSAAAIPLGAEALGALLGAAIGPYSFRPIADLTALSLVSFVGATLISGPLGEEFGWRGFALDEGSRSLGPRTAAILIAAAWSLWHLPAFLVPDLQKLIFPTGLSFPEFAAFTLTGGVVAAWLTNRSNGALAPAILFHLCLLSMLLAISERPPLTLTCATIAVFAVVAGVILIREPKLGYSER